MQHLLTLKDLENFLEDDPPSSEEPNSGTTASWFEKYKKAQSVIGISLSNDLLENVRDVTTTKEMWNAITNVFERHTLLNKLSARKRFYTATMSPDESVLQFSNRIRQLSSTLKSMNVIISESEMAMALLNGLPEEYNALISALDAIDEDETKLNFEVIKSRVIQEEQRIRMPTTSAQGKYETAALLTTRPVNSSRSGGHQRRSSYYCNFRKRPGHTESRCWAKFPHLDPSRNNPSSSKPALIANQPDEDPAVCLMAKYENSSGSRNSDKWFVDSGCSNHMTFNKSMFSS